MKRSAIADRWSLLQLSSHGRLDQASVAALTGADAGSFGPSYPIETMPAMVHTILESHGVIETPWKRGAAEACRWVAESDWVYRAEFDAEPKAAAGTRGGGAVYLSIDGADTVVDVYLNGTLVGSHSEMFRGFRLDVSSELAAPNVLLLHFRSVFERDADDPGASARILEFVDGDPERPIHRTDQNYVPYLGPHPLFSRVGVYADIVLESVGAGEIDDLAARVSVAHDLNRGTIHLTCGGSTRGAGSIVATLSGPSGEVVPLGANRESRVDISGSFALSLDLPVERPHLWWPRTHGDQPLYSLCVSLVVDGNEVDSRTRTIGFRRVEMPRPLHFTVNGMPVKLWGANWVSPHWMTAVWDHEKASKLLDLAENAHFNAMRIWGVVESPDDDLYEMADRRGILLWQDFTDLRLEPNNVNRRLAAEQSTHLVKRLQHHPCILMWCGNNEAAMWHDFAGHHDAFPGREIIEDIVGPIVRELDPDRFYLPSTPYHGFDPNDPQDHNTHGYTNVWYVHGYDYLNFATEDTRIGAPEVRSLRRFMAPEEIFPDGYVDRRVPGNLLPWPGTWMAYTWAESERKTGPVEQFYDATDAESLVYRIGAAERLYYVDTIERQRRGRPADDASGVRRCGGYIAWKFNDSWPEIYSAKVDYFLEPYIPYYGLRRAYAPILVSFDIGTYITVWVVNDSPEWVRGTLTVCDRNIEHDESHRSLTREVTLAPGASMPFAELTEFRTIERRNLLFATLDGEDGSRIADAIGYLDLERNIPFPDAKLKIRAVGRDLEIETDRFARSVVLTGNDKGDEFGWFFEDNYFDLMPGEVKRVRVLGEHTSGTIIARAFYSPHASTVDYRQP